MSDRVRIWEEFNEQRPINCAGDFVVARKGQFVVVAVVNSYREASKVIAALDPELVSTETEEP